MCAWWLYDVKTAWLNDVYYLDLNDPSNHRFFFLVTGNYLSEMTVASILPFSISSFWLG
jgi:hypothetical protein